MKRKIIICVLFICTLMFVYTTKVDAKFDYEQKISYVIEPWSSSRGEETKVEFILYKDNNLYGICDINYNEILPAEYSEIYFYKLEEFSWSGQKTGDRIKINNDNSTEIKLGKYKKMNLETKIICLMDMVQLQKNTEMKFHHFLW